jgi:hypothetical protein
MPSLGTQNTSVDVNDEMTGRHIQKTCMAHILLAFQLPATIRSELGTLSRAAGTAAAAGTGLKGELGVLERAAIQHHELVTAPDSECGCVQSADDPPLQAKGATVIVAHLWMLTTFR